MRTYQVRISRDGWGPFAWTWEVGQGLRLVGDGFAWTSWGAARKAYRAASRDSASRIRDRDVFEYEVEA